MSTDVRFKADPSMADSCDSEPAEYDAYRDPHISKADDTAADSNSTADTFGDSCAAFSTEHWRCDQELAVVGQSGSGAPRGDPPGDYVVTARDRHTGDIASGVRFTVVG